MGEDDDPAVVHSASCGKRSTIQTEPRRGDISQVRNRNAVNIMSPAFAGWGLFDRAHPRLALWLLICPRNAVFGGTRIDSGTGLMGEIAGRKSRLEKLLELLDRETSITRDTTHRECIHRIVTRDRESANSIDMTICFPCLTMRKPAFSNALTAAK